MAIAARMGLRTLGFALGIVAAVVGGILAVGGIVAVEGITAVGDIAVVAGDTVVVVVVGDIVVGVVADCSSFTGMVGRLIHFGGEGSSCGG